MSNPNERHRKRMARIQKKRHHRHPHRHPLKPPHPPPSPPSVSPSQELKDLFDYMSRGFSRNGESSASGSDLFPNMQLGFQLGVKYDDDDVCYGVTPEAGTTNCIKNAIFADKDIISPNDIRNNSTQVFFQNTLDDRRSGWDAFWRGGGGTSSTTSIVDLQILEKILSAAAGHTEETYVNGKVYESKYSVKQAQTILNAAAFLPATNILTLTDVPKWTYPFTAVVGLTYFNTPTTQGYRIPDGFGIVLGNTGMSNTDSDQLCACNSNQQECGEKFGYENCGNNKLGTPIAIASCTTNPKLKSNSVVVLTGEQRCPQT